MPENIRPYKGMQLDTFPTRKEEAFYNFALNTVLEGDNIAILQNERSNDISFLLPEGYVQIGAIPMSNNETAIFSVRETNNGISFLSKIGIWDGFAYVEHASLNLGFKKTNLIKGFFTIVNGCERIVYWSDGLNPDYFFNFDKPDDFKSLGFFDFNKFKVRQDIAIPVITNAEVIDGGGELLFGTYEFQVELLDSNLSAVQKSIVSKMVTVYETSTDSDYFLISGRDNQETNPDGSPPVSKSIRLTIEGLNTRYDYYRVYVIRRTGGDGINREVFKISEIQRVTSSTMTYLFTGIKNIDTRETIDNVLLRPPIYTTSDVNLIMDRRHVRANLKGIPIDYSKFQRFTDNITTKWVVENTTETDTLTPGSSKNPSTYFLKCGQCPDEIVALGVIYFFKQGFYSPVFHIPGRQSTSFDTALITVVPDSTTPTTTQVRISDVGHLNLGIGDVVQRWKLFNTASTTGGFPFLTGEMGYYESSSANYPEIEDCNGQTIYTYAGEKIRHHRLPKENHPGVGKNVIGIEFDNIVFPHPDITHCMFVMGNRDSFNRTVLDSGYANILETDFPIGGVTSPTAPTGVIVRNITNPPWLEESKYICFTSPSILVKKGVTPDYFHIIAIIDPTRTDFGQVDFDSTPENTVTVNAIEIDTVQSGGIPSPPSLKAIFRKVEKSIYISAKTTELDIDGFNDVSGVLNSIINHDVFVSKLDFPLDNPGFDVSVPNSTMFKVVAKVVRDVHNDLLNIRYVPISQPQVLLPSNIAWGGDTVASIGETPIIPQNFLFDFFNCFNYKLFFQSTINAGLFVSDNTRCGSGLNSGNIHSYFINKLGEVQDGEYYIDGRTETTICRKSYNHNPDFDNLQLQQGFLPLPLNFKYCSDCVEEYPNRIIWSEKHQPEGTRDSYRMFLSENYTITGENLGEITGLHYDNNQLIVNCKDGFVVKIPNPQAIQTDESELYIGTGDFLSLPERQLVTTDYGFGGCRNVFSTVRTPRGYVWLDERAGKIFLKSESLEELSSPKYGCSRWMKANLPLVLPIQFHELFGEEYTGGDSRYQLAYDPIHERLIVHKTDWKFTNIGITKVLAGDITFSNGKFYEGGAVLPFTNTAVFENAGFTISFSFILQAWSSFHSWQPFFMWTGYEAFYSNLEDNLVWKHNKQPDGISPANLSFYGTPYDWIIDYTVFSTSTMTLNSLLYYGETMLDYAPAIVDFPTFDRMWIYSSQQSTGLKNIVPLDFNTNPYGNQIGFSFTDVDVSKRAEDYRIGNIYDYSSSGLYYSEGWQDRLSFYNGTQGYIDKVPLASPTDITLYDLAPLRGKYFNIRLFSSSNLDMKFDFLASFTNPFEL